MLGMPAHHLDQEDDGVRRARLSVIARSIEDASERATCAGSYAKVDCEKVWRGRARELALLLLVQAYSESRLARNVHEGQCREFECDPYKSRYTGRVEHRSRTLWQMQRTRIIDSEWEQMVGVDLSATRKAAWAASKLLGRAYRACGSVAGAISRYAGVGHCDWSGAKGRARLYESLRQRASALPGWGEPERGTPALQSKRANESSRGTVPKAAVRTTGSAGRARGAARVRVATQN